MKTRVPLLGRLFWIVVILAILGLAVACAPAVEAPQTAAPEVSKTAVVEVPVEATELPAAASGEQPVTLQVWLPDYSLPYGDLGKLFDEFTAQNPNIIVETIYIPIIDYREKLLTNLAAGDPPDVALLSYNGVAEFQQAGSLLKLGDLQVATSEYIISEALESNVFNGDVYGLPWLRASCTSDYPSLVLFPPVEDRLEQAFKLLSYLVDLPIQEQIVKDHGWYPTTHAAYDSMQLSCPQMIIIRTPPGEVEKTILFFQEISPEFEKPLLGAWINPQNSTAYFENDQLVGQAAPMLENPPPGTFTTPSSYFPGLDTGFSKPATGHQAKALLQERSLILGLITLETPVNIVDPPPPTTIPKGRYAVRCGEREPMICTLYDSNNQGVVDVYPTVEVISAPVPVPSVDLQENSPRRFCWNLDGLRICIRVGS